ncbi:MAG: hypothetical protein MUO31_13195 [Thermodesulfovibrionales bacterium]|nr:hypothetical protein [Thermodesulfovibrionales bacterium]
MQDNKRCGKCKKPYPATVEYFYRDRSRIDGMTRQCKTCKREVVNKMYKEQSKSIKGRLRVIWKQMLQRCSNPRRKDYKYYGERGIKVNFDSFEDFLTHILNELKTETRGLDIDRVDTNGHYERGNIRFITHAENMKNRRVNK